MTTTVTRPVTDDLGVATGTLGDQKKGNGEQVALGLFIGVPFLAVIAAVPFAWGWGLTWRDVVIALAMYMLTGHGISIGFHRYSCTTSPGRSTRSATRSVIVGS